MIILPGDMYDAIPSLVGNIPTDAYAVAGYVDSISFTWPQSAWDRFPKSLHCTITTTGRLPAHFADVENGDLTPQQGYDLYQAGRIKGIYCNFATWQTVQDIFNANRKPHSPYFIAQYPGGGRVMPVLNGIEAVAHQYYNSNLYDRSAITDTFVALIGGTVTTPADIWGYPIPSPDGKTSFAALDWLRYADTYAGQAATQLATVSSAITALATAVAATDTDVKAAATAEATDHAATLAAIAKISAIDPTVLEQDIQTALTQAGWVPAPTAAQNAAAVAPAVLSLIAAQFAKP